MARPSAETSLAISLINAHASEWPSSWYVCAIFSASSLRWHPYSTSEYIDPTTYVSQSPLSSGESKRSATVSTASILTSDHSDPRIVQICFVIEHRFHCWPTACLLLT